MEKPILDKLSFNKCKKCGNTTEPYFGNFRPGVLMNELLLNHPHFLIHFVILNIDYLNEKAKENFDEVGLAKFNLSDEQN